MCGIAGIINFDGRVADTVVLQKMTALLRHRGPDGEGYWHNDERSVGLGHRRLAVNDLSPAASQPMLYAGRYVITMNGEIYNFTELSESLQKKGYTFQTRSDTEVLLAMYMEYKEQCLQYLDGMFAFALYDKSEKTLFCARDRFGEKPFYYCHQDKSFLFASEIKALCAAGVPCEADYKMLYYYLAYKVMENPFNKQETFFEGIFSLEPAHYLMVDGEGRIRKTRYWDLDITAVESNNNPSVVAEKVREMLLTSVKRRLRSDVAVGSSLSGGVDSSIIVAAVNKILSSSGIVSQKTFSARFQDPEKDEGRYIKILTDAVPVQEYQTWVSCENLIDDYEGMLWHQEEPIGGAGPVAQWEVMKLAASKDVVVLLDGQGADEVFAGYHHYLRPFLTGLFLNDRKKYEEQKQAYESLHKAELNLGKHLFMEAYYPVTMRRLGKIRRAFSIPAYLQDLHPDFLHSFKSLDPPFITYNSLNETLKYSSTVYGLGKLLKLADRNAMAFGREVRLPYLYHPLVEYLFSLPPEFKIRAGWTKWILRQAFTGFVPEEILWRKDKLGYEPPVEKWMETAWFRENLGNAVKALTDMGIINKPDKEKMWFYFNAYYFLKVMADKLRQKR